MPASGLTPDPDDEMAPTVPALSVVICTYNRAELLRQALESIGRQSHPRHGYEVIVVDNNSTDHTRSVAESFAREQPNLRYLLEREQGLSRARNLGWQQARGEYVAYMDDDSRAPPDWLDRARDVIDRHAPSVFGGNVFPWFDSEKPAWYRNGYDTHVQQEHAGPLDPAPSKHLPGMNIVFKRSLLQEVGGFSANLGMHGTRIGYAEETAVVNHVRYGMPGHLVHYEPNFSLEHYVRPEKMRVSWRMASCFASGRDSCRMTYLYPSIPPADRADRGRVGLIVAMTIKSLRLLLSLAHGLTWRDQTRYPDYRHYWLDRSLTHLFALGILREHYAQKSATRAG